MNKKIFNNLLFKIKLRLVVFLKLTYYKFKYRKQLKIGKNNKFRNRFKINIAEERLFKYRKWKLLE